LLQNFSKGNILDLGVMMNTGHKKQFSQAFKLLFRDSDQVCTGNEFAIDVGLQPIAPRAEFFSLNPLHTSQDRKFNGGAITTLYNVPGRRADLNVTRFHNFLFEMDNTPLELQLEYIKSCGIPWATVTYSGGKSYHAILSLEQPLKAVPHTLKGVEEYKRVWKQIAHVMTKRLNQPLTLIDSACQNPSRLSRTPGAFRADKKKYQELVHLGRLCSSDELLTLISEAPDIKPSQRLKPTDISATDEEQVKIMLPTALLNDLKFPKTWATGTSAGNYQSLFKKILWLIDVANPSYELTLSFLTKYTFPYLMKTGYPESKCIKALNDAYTMKGLL
jgi:hypothetical protein